MSYAEGSWHIPIIASVMQITGGVYVELGVRYGTCFNEVQKHASEAHGVDIKPCELESGTFWHMSTDEFFEEFRGEADVIFIDADHTYAQVKRDFENSLEILRPNGMILLHDTWPVDPETEVDTGSAWELAVELERGDFNAVTHRRYPGLTMVQTPALDRFACESS